MSQITPSRLAPGGCNALDIAKLFFACIVVGMHQHPFEGETFLYTWEWIRRMAVPFFFVASAFLFFQRNPGPAELKHYVSRMLKLYGFWFVILLPHTISLRCDPSATVLWNVGHMLHLFIHGSTFGGSWFLMALIITIPLVYWLEKKVGMRWTLAIALVIELFLQAYGWKWAMPQAAVDALLTFDAYFPGVHNSWLAAMIYVVAGRIIASRWTTIERWPLRRVRIAAVALMVLMAAWIIVMTKVLTIDSRTITRVPVVIFVFISVVRSNLTLNLPYRTLRRMSIIIYITHFLFIYLLKQAQMHVFHTFFPYTVRYLIVLTASILLSLVIVRLQRVRGFEWLKVAC